MVGQAGTSLEALFKNVAMAGDFAIAVDRMDSALCNPSSSTAWKEKKEEKQPLCVFLKKNEQHIGGEKQILEEMLGVMFFF